MKDPKRALTNFLEHEGLDLDIDFQDEGVCTAEWITSLTSVWLPCMLGMLQKQGHKCTIRLPIETERGDWVYAEGQAPRKKDAEHQACLDACKKLELHGLFGRGKALMGWAWQHHDTRVEGECAPCSVQDGRQGGVRPRSDRTRITIAATTTCISTAPATVCRIGKVSGGGCVAPI